MTPALNSLTGVQLIVPALSNPHFAAFTLPAVSPAEVRDAHWDPVGRLGAAREVLWISETGTRARTRAAAPSGVR
jgi:hypothetical protein